MKDISTLLCFTSLALVASVQALVAEPVHIGYGIASQCTNLRLSKKDWWVIGDCLTGVDNTTRITSAFSLEEKLTNKDGNITWVEPEFMSGMFFLSCSSCRLQAEDATLRCVCKRQWASPLPIPGETHYALHLDEHISTYNGHLLSNFSGPPVVPKSPSPYPVPEDFSFIVWGNFTCPGARGDVDPCASDQGGPCVDRPRDELDSSGFSLDGAGIKCWVPVVYWDDQFYMANVLQIVGEGMWEVEGFADEECKESVMKVYPEDMGICKPVGDKLVKAITVRPAFNGA